MENWNDRAKDKNIMRGRILVRTQHSENKARENWKTIGYFLGMQIFFGLMIASFSLGGKYFFGCLVAIPPLIAVATMSRKGLLFVFYFMCMTFMMVQRTF